MKIPRIISGEFFIPRPSYNSQSTRPSHLCISGSAPERGKLPRVNGEIRKRQHSTYPYKGERRTCNSFRRSPLSEKSSAAHPYFYAVAVNYLVKLTVCRFIKRSGTVVELIVCAVDHALLINNIPGACAPGIKITAPALASRSGAIRIFLSEPQQRYYSRFTAACQPLRSTQASGASRKPRPPCSARRLSRR